MRDLKPNKRINTKDIHPMIIEHFNLSLSQLDDLCLLVDEVNLAYESASFLLSNIKYDTAIFNPFFDSNIVEAKYCYNQLLQNQLSLFTLIASINQAIDAGVQMTNFLSNTALQNEYPQLAKTKTNLNQDKSYSKSINDTSLSIVRKLNVVNSYLGSIERNDIRQNRSYLNLGNVVGKTFNDANFFVFLDTLSYFEKSFLKPYINAVKDLVLA